MAASERFKLEQRRVLCDEPRVAIVKSTGSILNGISSAYDLTYVEDLRGIISEEEFVSIISGLNNAIQDFWPCVPCVTFAYLCSPFALLPFFPTKLCVDEAEKSANEYLERLNRRAHFRERCFNQ